MIHKSCHVLAVAVSIGLGGMAYGQNQPNPSQPQGSSGYGNTAPGTPKSDRARVAADTDTTPVSPNDLKQIHESMARIVEGAVMGGKFNEFVNEFSGGTRRAEPGAEAQPGLPTGPNRANAVQPGDRDQRGGNAGVETKASRAAADAGANLDNVIAQFRSDWKAKYGSDFKLPAEANQVFNDSFASINTSDLGEAARTASATIPPTVPTEPQNRAGGQPAGGAGRPTTDATHIDNRAVIIIQAGQGAPMTTVTLINAGSGAWRVDNPQGINPDTLRAALARNLDMLERDKANWPSDPREAYRAVAHHVFLAISDAGAGLMQGGSVVQPGDRSGADVGPGVANPRVSNPAGTPRR